MIRFPARLTALLAVATTVLGCELLTQVDRSKIPDGLGGALGTGGTGGTLTTGGTGGTMSTGGTGGTGGCQAASECPGPDTDCQTRACHEGTCGFDYVPSGMPGKTQIPGDCQIVLCDGKGVSALQEDPADPFDDGNACTDDSCVAGVPHNGPAMAGTACAEGKGVLCDGAGTCVQCLAPSDCPTAICEQHQCLPASCIDLTQNPGETDVDCGGGVCLPCGDGLKCLGPTDCGSGVCTGNVCQTATCADTVENGIETDVDCGGGACPKCKTGQGCAVDTDCVGASCSGSTCLPSCTDTQKNAGESDVDCGGPTCPKCDDGQACVVAKDCSSGVCTGGKCQVPTCTDSVKNGAETDVDCGGGTCTKCGDLQKCALATDCQSGVCGGGFCHAPTCADTVKNGGETDVDCGGAACINQGKACGAGLACNGPADCHSGVCAGSKCQLEVCGDGVTNGADGCDDGNTASGDGCSASCTVETGFTCAGAPSVCATTCGDGLKAGLEGCDDGNTGSGDGCSAGCAVEAGFTCAGSAPTVCAAVCGDGQKKGLEQCDDGNAVSGDGCSAGCAIEPGFKCAGSPSACTPICGDGQQKGSEGCDDGNALSGDGCSSTCAVEAGFACAGSPSVCAAVCGDGQKKGAEACDDGNLVSGDGCSPTCAVEPGYHCVGTSPSLCLPVCGDGQQKGSEGCDDGNLVSGDGCSAGCSVEIGFACAGTAPSVCAAICGDGKKRGAEACDDGNLLDGDGCSATCAIEPGYKCSGAPSACTTICGDGLLAGDEQCDDGNHVSGDGCSAGCTVEPGFDCGGEPSVCAGTCGDGQKKGAETCDDGNTFDGDGCSSSCTLELGWVCAGAPSVCATVCGDGIPAGNEDCDDGNTTDGDGCGSGCWQEYGYACSGAPSVCLPLCGDGYKTNAEACDDGNLVGGDGCSVTCAVEPGYACKGGLGSTSECAPICGDGLLTGNEACDDHNAVNGDGCSKSCAVEAGFTCAGAPSVCTTTCGDGLRAGAETCDDGNLVDGDGCSAVCHAEPGWEIEPNDTVDDANAFATVALSGVVHARVNAFADNDYFLFTVPPGSTADLLAETHDGLVSTCTTDIDTVIYVYDANGVQLGYDDQGGVGGCSLINVYGLVPGDYYVQVRPYSGGATYDYSLQLTPTFYLCGDGNLDAGEQCDDGNTVNGDGCSASCRLEIFNETEPNDTCATASGPTVIPPGPDGVLVGGQITPATEQDWFSFVVPAYADVRFETFDTYGPGTCELGVDTVIQVYKPSCTPQGAAVDQLGINGCSLIDPAVDPQTQHLAPGTYKVRVTSYQGGSTFAYTLQARFAALCGDGVVEGSEQCDGGLGCGADCRPVPKCGNGVREAGEQCDDGNTAAGDGCGATCQWEKTAEVEPNNTPAAADAALPVITGSVNLGGSINAIGDVDLYKLHAATQRTVRFEIFDNTGVDCIAMPAMTLTLLDSTGAEIRRDTPPSDFTGSGIGVCPALVFDLAPGDYYLQAARLSFGTVPSYFLQIKYETDNGAKVEPNDTMAQATPDPGRDTAIFGAHVAMNLDWYAITIPPGQPLSLRAEIVEGDALLSCEADEIDSELSLFDDQGNQLVFDDDDGRGYCSLIDGTGATPLHPQAHNLPPGTYYLQVGEDISSDFNYKLAVTLR